MKYTLVIDQKMSLEWGLNLPQALIFSVIYELPSWAKSKEFKGKNWGRKVVQDPAPPKPSGEEYCACW